jgi:hypothetical protein
VTENADRTTALGVFSGVVSPVSDTKGHLIAEVRYGSVAHRLATKSGKFWYFKVRLVRNRMLTCDCGSTMKYLPNAIDYDRSWFDCSHLVALFKGNVTTDPRDTGGDYRLARGRFVTEDHTHFVRLTEAGKKALYWRWIALKLGPDTSMGSS